MTEFTGPLADLLPLVNGFLLLHGFRSSFPGDKYEYSWSILWAVVWTLPLTLLYQLGFSSQNQLLVSAVNGSISLGFGYFTGRVSRTLLAIGRDLERKGHRGFKEKLKQLSPSLKRAWQLFLHPQESYIHWKMSIEFIGEYCDGQWVLVELQDGKCYVTAIHVFDARAQDRDWCYLVLNTPYRYEPASGAVDKVAICEEMLVSLSDVKLIKRAPNR